MGGRYKPPSFSSDLASITLPSCCKARSSGLSGSITRWPWQRLFHSPGSSTRSGCCGSPIAGLAARPGRRG